MNKKICVNLCNLWHKKFQLKITSYQVLIWLSSGSMFVKQKGQSSLDKVNNENGDQRPFKTGQNLQATLYKL